MDFKQKSLSFFLENKLISLSDFDTINEYRNRKVFSLNKELLFLLYLSIIIFTTGMGMLIYQNINSIGHTILLILIFVLIVGCYYYCFKNAEKFQKREIISKNPFVSYILLLGMILICTFVAYIQFQHHIFGNNYNIATIIPAIIGLYSAYYFDHKGVLSIAITGLASGIGLSVNPKSLLGIANFNANLMSGTGILLGLLLILWCYYCSNIGLKKHFALIYYQFALQLIAICCLFNLTDKYWFLYTPVLVVTIFYFFLYTKKHKSVSLFIFTFLYAFIGLNLIQFKLLDCLNLLEGFFFFYLIFTMVSIFGFIRLIQKYKN